MRDSVSQFDDEQLVKDCREGDRRAFSLLVEKYWDPLFGWLYRLTGSAHAAEDLTQETFLKAWKALPTYTSGPGFRGWLFRIARNAWIDQSRRPKLKLGEPLADIAEARDAEPIEASLEQERAELLDQAIRELPDDYRESLLLRMQQSMSFAEIATVVNVKEDTVRWRVYKARQLLLKQLADYMSREELPS